jgi:ribosome-associated protein
VARRPDWCYTARGQYSSLRNGFSTKGQATLKPLELARVVVEILEDKKAENIVLMDLQEHTVVADYFVICSATSDRQLEALAEAVTDTLHKHHRLKVPRVEGHAAGGWLLIDFRTVVVHIFSVEQRRRYRLDELWHETKTLLRIQ